MKNLHGKSARILDEIKERQQCKQKADAREEKQTLLLFHLGDKLFAVFGENALEVLPVGKICFLPRAPEYVLGAINVRGDVESVVEVCHFLRLPRQKTGKHSRIVIATGGGIRSGILTGAVEDVVEIAAHHIQPPAAALFTDEVRPYIAGEFPFQNQQVVVLDIEKLFKKLQSK